MRHDETRDNTTTIEATIIEADNREELQTAATWSECGCEDCRPYYEHHTDYDCP